MRIVATLNASALEQLAQRLDSLQPADLAAALNAGGEAMRQGSVKAETAQTGLKRDTIDRAQTTVDATPGNLTFKVRSKGGDVRLKFFGAKEAGSGVVADPWATTKYYPGAFIDSGFGSKRAPSPKLNGQVYRRVDASSRKIQLVKSGLFIPDEMLKGSTEAALETGAARTFDALQSRLFAIL